MNGISDNDKKILQQFIGEEGQKTFSRLYSVKADGCTDNVFHEKCDNKGPTVTLVYNTEGEVYGGYASVSWQSVATKHIYDHAAFLFLLRGTDEAKPKKFPVKKRTSALILDTHNCPTFGSGPDLQVCSGDLTNADEDAVPIKVKMTPASYEKIPESLGDVVSPDSVIDDVVVYSVEDVKYELMEVQWRGEPMFDKQYMNKLMAEVENYSPLKAMGVSEDALQHVNILFLGPIGAGKSSFLNCVESVFRGYVSMSASAGSRGKSVTSMYRQYPFTASDNRNYLKFQLCDCRGLENGFNLGKDIEAILDGHAPNNYIFNSSSPLNSKTHGYINDPKLKDKIHCVVYVLDAEKYSLDLDVSFISEEVKEQITDIQDKVDQRGIPQLILLNKIDNACPLTKVDTSAVYRSVLIQERCFHAANCLGLPPLTVLPMKNYFMELSNTDVISTLALYNVRQMLRSADTYLRVNHLEELRGDRYETHLR